MNKLAYGILTLGMVGRQTGQVYANIPSYAGGCYLGDAVEVVSRL